MRILTLLLILSLTGCATYEFKPAPAQRNRLEVQLETFKNSNKDLVRRINFKLALLEYLKASNQYTYGNADRIEQTDGELIKLAEDLLK